jgi:hypothetical protein
MQATGGNCATDRCSGVAKFQELAMSDDAMLAPGQVGELHVPLRSS